MYLSSVVSVKMTVLSYPDCYVVLISKQVRMINVSEYDNVTCQAPQHSHGK